MPAIIKPSHMAQGRSFACCFSNVLSGLSCKTALSESKGNDTMNAQTKEKAPAVVTAPTQKTVAETRAKIEAATLETLVAIAKDVHSTIARLQGTATQIQGSLTSKVIALVSKQTLESIALPVRDTLTAVGGRVPNLSTVRMGCAKMAMRYGMDHTLPHWQSVAEVKASGDAAYAAAVQSVIVDGVFNPDRRVEVEASAKNALVAFGVADNAQAKFLKDLAMDIQAAAEGAEESEGEEPASGAAPSSDDAQIVADAAAQLQAEVALLREMLEAARTFVGIPQEATDAEVQKFFTTMEGYAALTMDEFAAAIAD